MEGAFIYDHLRTPRGRGRGDGALHEIAPVQLAAQVLAALRGRHALDTALVDDAILGCTNAYSEQEADIARLAALVAGYGQHVPGIQIDRFCASGLEAVNLAAAERGKHTRAGADVLLARIHPTVDYADLAACDFVVEAVFENREVKADVTRRAAAVLPASAVFGSNTSTLPITGLARAFDRPEDFIGIHFFLPVERMPLIELILGEKTSRTTLARALDLVARLRKMPIVVNDSRGFFTSRVFGTFVKEGIAMLREGVLPALIENAARQAGMPVGPLAVVDEVSLEITLKVYDQRRADGVQPPHEPALSVDATRKMVDQLGRKGKAAGAGFYEYPEGARKFLWPGLAEHWPAAQQQPGVEELKRRFLTIQALEAARCVEEGVVIDPAAADVGSIFGIGYPAWTGGVLSYVETVGLQRFVDQATEFAQRRGERYRPSPWLVERVQRNEVFHRPTALAA